MPGKPCMRCLGYLTENLLGEEAMRYGAAGGRPQVIWPNGVLASTAVGLLVSLFLPWNERAKVPIYVEYDGNSHRVFESRRLVHLEDKVCGHYPADEIGDPFWEGDSTLS